MFIIKFRPGSRKLLIPLLLILLPFFFIACSKSGANTGGSSSPLPIVDSVSPIIGGVGTIITIMGHNFFPATTQNTVTINNVTASILKASDTELQVMVPVARSGSIAVTTASGSVNGPFFTYSISPIVAVSRYNARYGGYSVAAYWANGIFHNLTSGTSNADAFGLTTSGPDLLVVGHEYFGANTVAKIWKNGIAKDLAPSTAPSDATCIVTSGNDIYIGGYVTKSNKKTATVWKNEVAYSITDGANDAIISSIAVSGSDLYACGYENNGTTNIAKFWKNGIATALSNGQYDAGATGITISGGDILVVGNETRAPYGYNTYGFFWKNGVQSVSMPISVYDYTTYANSIIVSGSDTLIVGHYYKNSWGTTSGYIWANTRLNFSYPLNGIDFKAITVDSGIVYIAGAGPDLYGTYSAKFWKNGLEVVLTDTDKGGIANAIIVR